MRTCEAGGPRGQGRELLHLSPASVSFLMIFSIVLPSSTFISPSDSLLLLLPLCLFFAPSSSPLPLTFLLCSFFSSISPSLSFSLSLLWLSAQPHRTDIERCCSICCSTHR